MGKILLIGFIGGILILISNTIVVKTIKLCHNGKTSSEDNSSQVKTAKATIDLTKKRLIPLYLALVVSEEYFFRYLLFGYLSSIWSSLIVSVLISTTVFTLLHFHYKYKMIQIFIMGLILCGTYIMTDNLISPIISHFINNFTIIYLLKDKKI